MLPQPLVSFILLAYNQESYIREAVAGAFSQTYSPLEIIMSDDGSSDRTFAILQEMAASYKGPHKIRLIRNDKNLGIGMHFNKLMEIADGQIIELAAGDDISLPWRTSESVRLLLEHPELTCLSLEIHRFAVSSEIDIVKPNSFRIQEVYTLSDWLIYPSIHVNAAARAFWKYTHDYFGPLYLDCHNEDAPNLLRCLLHGKAGASNAVGVLYRWNGLNSSAPDKLWKLPFHLTHKEYFSTIETAYKKKLIDKPTRDHATSILLNKCRRTILLQNAILSDSPISHAPKVIFSSVLSISDKLNFCMRCIRHVIKILFKYNTY